MSARCFDDVYKISARRFDHISSNAATELLRAVEETFIYISWSRACVPMVQLDMDALPVRRNSQNKSSWFVVAILLSMKSEIDKSVLCIISDVFVAVVVCTTAKYMQDYNANKILPDLKYTKQCIRRKIK